MVSAKLSIAYMVGDATAPKGGGQKIIVHVCNDIGGWGGFVVALSRRWPEPERRYRAWHRGEESEPFELGRVQFVPVTPDTTVANLIGQHDIKSRDSVPPIRYQAIRDGLRRVSQQARQSRASVHMPRIGCGLAGGRWEEVCTIVEEELAARGIAVTVYDLPS